MSLYNNVADGLKGLTGGGNFLSGVDKGLREGIGSAASRAADAAGGGALAKNIAQRANIMAGDAASNAMNSYIPPEMKRAINAGAGSANILLQGGSWEDAAVNILESGVADKALGMLGGRSSMNTRSQLYGGITAADAKRIHSEAISTRRAKKNLFLLKVSSALQGDFSQEFNLFCTDIEHAPVIIAGDRAQIGGAVVDLPNANEVDEMRITTMDDRAGTMKKWFEQHGAAVVARDGTVGVPAAYAITITIEHAFVGDSKGFTSKGLFRAVTYESSLSRREDSLEEITMSFTQLDTFMRP